MVEVDVFWSYGIGASFALGAFRQLRKLQAEKGETDDKFGFKDMMNLRRIVKEVERGDSPAFNNQYFTKTLLFLACLFVPSGANLLWTTPNWETMQVGSYETIPGWLVSIFSITNVTQGIMGYWVTYNYLMRGKYYTAAMQTVYAYLCFWFILVNGWDKTGYQRFFSKDREAFENWKWTNVFGWLLSPVVKILLSYGTVFIPLMLFWITKWLQEGFEMEGLVEEGQDQTENLLERARLCAYLLFAVFGLALGGAILAHILIRLLGWTGGLLAFAAIWYAGSSARFGIGPAIFKRIIRVDSIEGTPAWELAGEELEKELASISA
jgi:hypothetical protein